MDRVKNLKYFVMENISILVGSLGGGGAEKVAINISNTIKKNISLISLTSKFDYDPNNISEEVKLVIYNEKRIRFSILKYLFYLRTNKPKYILSTSRDTNLVLSFVSFFLNYSPKLIFREENTLENKNEISREQFAIFILNKYFPKLMQIIVSLAYLRCSKVIANSIDTASDIKSILMFKKPIVKFIPNPVLPIDFNTNRYPKSNHPWFKDPNIKVILGVGRLAQQKRFDILLRAFSLVVKKEKNFRLIICGQGPKEKYLKELSIELGIENLIIFKGFVKDIYPYFKSADIFCLTSEFEGFGNVIVEAMSFGLKIILTECRGGPRSIFKKNKFIEFVPINDFAKLSDTILRTNYGPSPKPFLKKEALKYKADSISKEYLKEIYSC